MDFLSQIIIDVSMRNVQIFNFQFIIFFVRVFVAVNQML